MKAEISVVVPTYRRERVLVETIDYLLEQRSEMVEIIVVDQTEEHTEEVRLQLAGLNNDKSIQWLRLLKPSIPFSMNVGAKSASGDILLFLDDDVIPDINLFTAHLAAHRKSDGDLIAGRVLQPWHDDQHDTDTFTRTVGEYKSEFIGCNFSIRRDLLLRLGGFDENFKGAAYRYELEFADRLLQAGYRIWYEPKALIRHLHHGSGGTRSKGGHLTTWKPRHPVGAYYYLFVSRRVSHRAIKAMNRFFRSVLTRHHLRKPWYIPVTLTSEMLGLFWALWLRLKGPVLPFLEQRASVPDS